jgi:toxin ParE1/3/4
MSYRIIRVETADSQFRSIILFIAEKFGNNTALAKLDALETAIYSLAENPEKGMIPHYPILRRLGYRVLIAEKDLIFYKIDDEKKTVIIYAVIDQRQDYLNTIMGM